MKLLLQINLKFIMYCKDFYIAKKDFYFKQMLFYLLKKSWKIVSKFPQKYQLIFKKCLLSSKSAY